jgi:ribosome biogenesis GTPase A
MIVGIPNVGKSSFINRVAGRKAAEASDKPGVTRGRQWITIGDRLELLDTPGILWPKFDSQTVGENLAFTGAVKDDVLDREALAANLMLRLRDTAPSRLIERYKIEPAGKTGSDLLGDAAKKRGFLMPGGYVDTERMAAVLLDEFRGGRLGRITLEMPPSTGDDKVKTTGNDSSLRSE